MGKGAEGIVPPWIFIHGTDKVERSLMVLFFDRFSIGPPGDFSADALAGGK